MSKKKLVIAHRGASSLAVHENTLESFLLAIKLGADMVEFDIRRTLDKKLIVFHDKHLKFKKIQKYTYDEINRITQADNYHVPLLKDVLELCRGKIRLDIELKEGGYEEDVLALVKSRFKYDEFFMKSFKDDVVLKIKKLDKKITTGLLIGRAHVGLGVRTSEYFPHTRLKACKADFISPSYAFLTPDFILRMKLLKKPIYPWTVNDTKGLWYQLHTCIDGIITDRPDIALSLRR